MNLNLIILVIVTIFLSGCSATHPPVSEYKINAEYKTQAFENSSCSNKSLKIAHSFSSPSLMSLKMDYGIGKVKQFSYTQSQWTQSPSSAISLEILESLRELKLFKSVQTSKSRSRSDMILETNIEDFMQYYNSDENISYVNSVISFTLIDAKSNNVIAAKTFTSKVNVSSLNAEGGVKALNSSLSTILVNSSKWFAKICQ